MQNKENNLQSRISLFLARNIYPWLIAWKPNQQKYREIISGLLPEALQQHQSKKDNLNSVLEKWSNSSDDEIQTISNLLKNAITLKERSWLIALAALMTLGGMAATIYFVSQPRIPTDSKCSIDQDCLAIAKDANVIDIDSEDLNDSKLTIRITQGATGNDRLAIHHGSNNVEDICVMGNQVAYQGFVIARFTGGKGNEPLAITFKVEPPPKTGSNVSSENQGSNPPTSNFSEDKISRNNRCITDGNGNTAPQNITADIVRTVLNNIVYLNNQTSEVGERILEITLIDSNGGGSQESRYKTIALVKEQKLVKLKVPSSQVVKENSRLNINGINITNLSFPNDQDITVLLEVKSGKITISDQAIKQLTSDNIKDDKTKKISLSIKDNKTKKVILTGTIDQISSLLREMNSITYQSDKNFQGDDVLSVSIDDGSSPDIEEPDLVYPPKAKFGAVKGDITIRVRPKNAPDILNAPDDAKVNEDTGLLISSLKIQDPDSKSVTATFTVDKGKIIVLAELNGTQVTNNPTSSVTLQGTVDQINNNLVTGIIYQGEQDFYGNDFLKITVSDGIYSDDKIINITVNAINDPPVIDIGQEPYNAPVSYQGYCTFLPANNSGRKIVDDPCTITDANDGSYQLRWSNGQEMSMTLNPASIDGNPGQLTYQTPTAATVKTIGGRVGFCWNCQAPARTKQPQPQLTYQPPSQPPPKASSRGTNATVSGTPGTKNIRSGAGTAYGVVRTVRTGDRLQILGSSYDRGGYQWYKVYHPQSGTTGWIAAQLISSD